MDRGKRTDQVKIQLLLQQRPHRNVNRLLGPRQPRIEIDHVPLVDKVLRDQRRVAQVLAALLQSNVGHLAARALEGRARADHVEDAGHAQAQLELGDEGGRNVAQPGGEAAEEG